MLEVVVALKALEAPENFLELKILSLGTSLQFYFHWPSKCL